MRYIFFIIIMVIAELGAPVSFSAKGNSCKVIVSQVLEAGIYRGFAHLEQIREDTHDSRLLQRYAHSGYHLSCFYRVEINKKSYRYYAEFENILQEHSVEYCNNKEIKKEIKNRILEMTQQCTRLEAPDSFGYSLKPIP